ncbi:hypothetical protein LRY60_01975 [Candidatus Woesebacteria bacterium]|nr:hypothetical protein [Candidatus Woesebacteria bacterium]
MVLATAVVLLVPFVAMQLTQQIRWTSFDFLVMGGLLFGTGSAFVFTARKTKPKYRVVVGIGFALVLLLIWAELAVGVFTSLGQ